MTVVKYMALATILLLCLSVASADGQERVLSLLDSDPWQKRDTAVSIVSQQLDVFKCDSALRQSISRLFSYETNELRNPAGESQTHESEGYGEHLLDLLALTIKLQMPETIPDLLDWAHNSSTVSIAVMESVKRGEYRADEIFLIIKHRFSIEEPFYQRRRGSYLRLACSFMDSTGYASPLGRSITKEMVLHQLGVKSNLMRLAALDCAEHFLSDSLIMNKIREMSGNDPFTRLKDGEEIYPIRDKARDYLLPRVRKAIPNECME